MNIINTKKSEEKLEINDENLLDFYESKKNLLCPRFKIPKNLLKTILFDNEDSEWVIDYCKMITSKKVNRRAYFLSYIFVFLYLSVPLISLSLMIYLWAVRDNVYWWVLIILIVICIPLHIFQGWIFSNKRILKNKNNRSVSIGAIIIFSNYWECLDLMAYGFEDKNKIELKEKIIKNCFDNIYEFIDDDAFIKLITKQNINISKRKYLINSFFMILFVFFIVIINLWLVVSFVPAIIYVYQMIVHR